MKKFCILKESATLRAMFNTPLPLEYRYLNLELIQSSPNLFIDDMVVSGKTGDGCILYETDNGMFYLRPRVNTPSRSIQRVFENTLDLVCEMKSGIPKKLLNSAYSFGIYALNLSAALDIIDSYGGKSCGKFFHKDYDPPISSWDKFRNIVYSKKYKDIL